MYRNTKSSRDHQIKIVDDVFAEHCLCSSLYFTVSCRDIYVHTLYVCVCVSFNLGVPLSENLNVSFQISGAVLVC